VARATWRRLALASAAALPALALGLWLVSRLGAGLAAGHVEVRPAPASLQAGAAVTPEAALGFAGLALLVAAMGTRLLGPVIAVVTAIAVLQAAGVPGSDAIRVAFAVGMGLAAVNASPLVRMPRALAVLAAVAGGLMVALGDVSWLAAALMAAGYHAAMALFQLVYTALGADFATATLALIAAVGFLGRAAARARGPAGVALSIAVGYFALVTGYLVLQVFTALAVGALAYLALLVAAVIAVIDIFAALERGDVAALVWAGPLAILARIAGFAVGPAIAALAAVSALVAAFTLREDFANTAVLLAMASLAAA
jgi:hypothetical protein